MHARERKGTDKMSRDGMAVFMRLSQVKFSKEERNSPIVYGEQQVALLPIDLYIK